MTDAGLSNDCRENSETAKAAEEIAKEMQLCESLRSSQALPAPSPKHWSRRKRATGRRAWKILKPVDCW
jgi:hypothetical protein